jgi:perosamine synthetase
MSDQPLLPYGRQWIDDDDIAAVVDVLRGDYLTTGPSVERFEHALCSATGASHAVAVNSGTSALHAAYHAAGLRPGENIVTSPLTFAATANAARFLGAEVRFVDVDPSTGNLDPTRIEAALDERTRLVVPVDFAGHPADYDAIDATAKRHDLTVIADAAHSLGASYRGRRVGTLAALTEISLHPVKPVTTAEGGAVLTNDANLAREASEFRTHGITRDRSRMMGDDGPWYYEQQSLGFNYRLTDVQSALGTSQVAKLERFIERRRAIARRYSAALAEASALHLPVVENGVEPGWHLYVVRVAEPSRRRTFFERLRALGLLVQVHYVPVYFHPYYAALGYRRGLCPNAEDFYARSVSLPIYPRMTDDDVDSSIERVLRAVREVL